MINIILLEQAAKCEMGLIADVVSRQSSVVKAVDKS